MSEEPHATMTKVICGSRYAISPPLVYITVKSSRREKCKSIEGFTNQLEFWFWKTQIFNLSQKYLDRNTIIMIIPQYFRHAVEIWHDVGLAKTVNKQKFFSSYHYNRYKLQTLATVRETIKSRVILYLPDETNGPPRNRISLLLIRNSALDTWDEQRSIDTAVRAKKNIYRVSGGE